MKPPKFRIWYPINKTHEKYALDKDNDFYLSQCSGVKEHSDHPMSFVPEDKLIFELSTGVEDSSGCEIYEGDIVKIEGESLGYEIKYPFEVKYGIFKNSHDEYNSYPLGFFLLEYDPLDKNDHPFYMQGGTYTIIGNIHEAT